MLRLRQSKGNCSKEPVYCQRNQTGFKYWLPRFSKTNCITWMDQNTAHDTKQDDPMKMVGTSDSFCGPTSTHYYPATQQFPKSIYIFAYVINVLGSVTATLGNILILFALRKCHSIHSPSKALLCSLALPCHDSCNCYWSISRFSSSLAIPSTRDTSLAK